MPQIMKERRIVMKNGRILIGILAIGAALLLGLPQARAQEEEQKGVDQGNYNVKQSVEFGGRFTDIFSSASKRVSSIIVRLRSARHA